jgi:hypothetical protein
MNSKIAAKSDAVPPEHQNESTHERVLKAVFALFCEVSQICDQIVPTNGSTN